MNRRWRHDAAAQHDTLQAVSAFTRALPPLTAPLGVADEADVYAVYSVLHSKSRHPQVRELQSRWPHPSLQEREKGGWGMEARERTYMYMYI